MIENPDEDHLGFAIEQARVLDSFNVCDFWRLHPQLRPHGGKVLAQQQRYSTGEQMRRLLRVS